jgi:MFS family permease
MPVRTDRKVKNRSTRILPVIIVSQFTGTSLWFAGNAVLGDLQRQWELGNAALSYMTSSVQLGFIFGTLLFAFFTISDRFSPRVVFFLCSLLGALSNLGIYLVADGLVSLLVLRFSTGFFLAGIYPVGMKIAAGWYRKGLGQALGYLVGALVVGTAFPHLLKSTGQSYPWEHVILSISAISAVGGILMLVLVPDGPYAVKGTKFNSKAFATIFRSRDLRSASFGYFGHMWELYTLWAFFPVLIKAYGAAAGQPLNVPFWSFWVIAVGCLGCIGGGILSFKLGSPSIAFYQLVVSGICCLASPFLFHAPLEIFLGFLILLGIVVVGDSPQFSALTAQTAPRELVGSALTIVTSIGFFITIISIQFTNYLTGLITPQYIFLFLVVGPIFGLINLWPLYRKNQLGIFNVA